MWLPCLSCGGWRRPTETTTGQPQGLPLRRHAIAGLPGGGPPAPSPPGPRRRRGPHHLVKTVVATSDSARKPGADEVRTAHARPGRLAASPRTAKMAVPPRFPKPASRFLASKMFHDVPREVVPDYFSAPRRACERYHARKCFCKNATYINFGLSKTGQRSVKFYPIPLKIDQKSP